MTEINMRGIGAARWDQSIWRRETRPILRIPAGRASWLPRLVLLSLVLRLLMLSASSHAANPSDWWVHITNDRAEQIAQMLAEGADPNAVSPGGQPSIMQAIRDDAWGVYDVLLKHPDTVFNAINRYRETPLMYLAVIGETERAKELIRRGALVNRPGWTPLHYAASTGQLDTAQLFLDQGAQVNALAPDGTTPLMMAAYAGSEPMVRLLLAAGADPTLRTNQDYDVVDWANFKSHTILAGKLRDLLAAMRAPGAETASGAQLAAEAGIDSGKPTEGPTGSSTADENGSRSSERSSSRYFDLDRFDDPANSPLP